MNENLTNLEILKNQGIIFYCYHKGNEGSVLYDTKNGFRFAPVYSRYYTITEKEANEIIN